MTGKIKFYNDKKGFGFIVDSDTNADIFFHFTGLKNKDSAVIQDSVVEYEVGESPKGKQAINISLLKT